MLNLLDFIFILKVIIAISIFFVWVIRYPNIVKEFEQYNLPTWLRDLTGIIKLTLAFMLVTGLSKFVIASSSFFCFMMLCAIVVHILNKNPLFKMIPALTLFSSSAIILIGTFNNL